MMLKNVCPALLLCAMATLTMPRPAIAAEWQYCLAPSHADNKVYMSEPFPTAELGYNDGVFGKALARFGARYDDIQCPRADSERAIATMRAYAITFNRDSGNAVIFVQLDRAR
jgi:hypothetical protein